MAKKKKAKQTRQSYIEKQGGDSYSFSLIDAHTVARLQKNGDITLPKRKIDVSKDERWNTKMLNSRLMQGIMNGDSIPKIAGSLLDVVGSNSKAAVRTARTMVTGAENAGRFDSYKDLQEQGVVQKKVWIATLDDRVRASHEEIDGEEVDIDEPFSNGLMYPGDPSGDPSEVYNCRCTMKTHIVGFSKAAEDEVEETEEIDAPDDVIADIQEYVDGTGEHFTAYAEDESIQFVKDNMETSDKTFYRVEDARFTADRVEVGETFSFSNDIRSFSDNEESMYQMLNEAEEISTHEQAIFETRGEIEHFPVDKYLDHNEFAYQHESLLNGEFKVLDKYYDDEDTLRVVIEQVKKESATTDIADGKDITTTWKRRADKFDFAIEDVVNAQGFDGKPRVVDAKEFDEAVKKSNFIAQRTYSAPDQETLDAYRDQLYNGKWYIDCSTGGAQYGQGMYCAGNYSGKLTDEIKQEMKDYQQQNTNYSGAESVHTVETLTLDSSAKIISREDLILEWAKEYDPQKVDIWARGVGPDNVQDAAILAIQNRRKQELIKEGLATNEYKAGLLLDQETKKLSRLEERNYWLKKAEEAGIPTDSGSYAALKGYDAIRTAHGTSGADTVILNRTKCIFKKGDK